MAHTSKLGKWLTPIVGIFSVGAVLISLAAYFKDETRRGKDLPYEVIPKAYEKYYEMNRIELDKPYLTHLFVTPDRYSSIKRNVQEATGVLSAQQRAQYLLEERAVADFIFTYYEQNLYQWDATKDKERQFTNDVLTYLRGSLLRNPRLVYWWREQNGGLETSYYDTTRADWKKYVLGELDITKPAVCDAVGPLGDPREPAPAC